MIDLENKEPVTGQEVLTFFAKMAKKDYTTNNENETQENLEAFKKDMIDGRRWFKADVLVMKLTGVYMNPTSYWLKRFLCKCEPVKYSCCQCSVDNMIEFSAFRKSYFEVWRKMDSTTVRCPDDYEHRNRIEKFSKQCESISNTRLIIHETVSEWFGMDRGNVIVRVGNHRLVALLVAEELGRIVPIYYGELE